MAVENDSGIKITSRKHPTPDDLQFLSTDVLKMLKHDMPADAYARIAVTMTDLYPDPTWNFVFGQASPSERVGVYSFARYGEPGDKQFLHRCLHVFAHETGHMFAIMHCIHFECVMNGSNHLAESDATPLQLCPVCLRKLHAANAFDIRKRYEGLRTFFKKRGFEDETEWMKRRLVDLP
jgi:archaemetzincin